MDVETENMSETLDNRLDELLSPEARGGGAGESGRTPDVPDRAAPGAAAALKKGQPAKPFTKDRARQVQLTNKFKSLRKIIQVLVSTKCFV